MRDKIKTKEYNRKYREKNHEKLLEYYKKYYREHPEIVKAKASRYKEWRKENVEHERAIKRKYFENNKEKIYLDNKAWRAKNPEKVTAQDLATVIKKGGVMQGVEKAGNFGTITSVPDTSYLGETLDI